MESLLRRPRPSWWGSPTRESAPSTSPGSPGWRSSRTRAATDSSRPPLSAGSGRPRPAGDPRHSVGAGAGFDAARFGQRLQIDDRDDVVSADGDVRVRAVRRDEDPFGTLSELQPLDLLARRRVDDDELAGVEIRDEHELAVRRELQPVRSLRLEIQRL